MSSYSQFLLDQPPARITAENGIVKAYAFGKEIFQEAYTSGDYDDKLQTTIRGYKALVLDLAQVAQAAPTIKPLPFIPGKLYPVGSLEGPPAKGLLDSILGDLDAK